MGVDRERKVKSQRETGGFDMFKLIKYVATAFYNQVHHHYYF